MPKCDCTNVCLSIVIVFLSNLTQCLIKSKATLRVYRSRKPCGIWTSSLSPEMLPLDIQIWPPSKSRMMIFPARTIILCVLALMPMEALMICIPGLLAMRTSLTMLLPFIPPPINQSLPKSRCFPILFLTSSCLLPLSAPAMRCTSPDLSSEPFRITMWTTMTWIIPRRRILLTTLPLWTFLHLRMIQTFKMDPSLAPMIPSRLARAPPPTRTMATWPPPTSHGTP